MCGYYFSTIDHPKNTVNLRRRGPEAWNTLENDLGKFGHALLNTIGERNEQPLLKNEGTLLYNGSVYNAKPKNDALWIADNLTGDVSQCVDFVRTLNGEYSITWATGEFVLFCTDTFGIRPLYYKHDLGLTTASLFEVLEGSCSRCEANVIYVYDRKTNSIQSHTNTHWDLTQRDNHWDNVMQASDKAVYDRHDNSVYAVSGGYDSGVIMASAVKQFGLITCVTNTPNGEQDIIEQRQKVNQIQPVQYMDNPTGIDLNKIFDMMGEPPRDSATMGIYGQSAYIQQCMKPYGKKVLVTGEGGDEVYSDYGYHGKKIRWHSTTGGIFPEDLSTVWPWHDDQNILTKWVSRAEAVGGYWGIELRLPLLDKRLVQAWLNTTCKLKNKEYKGWMAQYMTDHNMPFEKGKKAGYSERNKYPQSLEK